MRFTLCLIPLMLVGCLSSGSPANPMKCGKAAPVSSADAVAPAPTLPPAPLSLTSPPPAWDGIEEIKVLFELWKSLEPKMLKLAHELSDEELSDLNDWLRPQGSEIKRTCTDPTHDHGSKSKGSKSEKKAERRKSRVF